MGMFVPKQVYWEDNHNTKSRSRVTSLIVSFVKRSNISIKHSCSLGACRVRHDNSCLFKTRFACFFNCVFNVSNTIGFCLERMHISSYVIFYVFNCPKNSTIWWVVLAVIIRTKLVLSKLEFPCKSHLNYLWELTSGGTRSCVSLSMPENVFDHGI